MVDSKLLENLKVQLEELPTQEESDFKALEQDYLYLRLTSRGLFFLLLAGVLTLLTFTANLPLLFWLPAWGGVLLVIFIAEILGFKIKGYAIRSKDVSYKTGLLFFYMTSVPLNRIQHVEFTQGPLGRLFDLASVKVFTAGGSSSDMSIHGLTKERAIALRDYIIKLSAQYE
jgi:membrane protein YdbS with pleckstrin-like domain